MLTALFFFFSSQKPVLCWFPSDFFPFNFSAGSNLFDTVDIFNANTGAWTTAALSKARRSLSATSLPDQGLAMFAGGDSELFVWILASDCK